MKTNLIDSRVHFVAGKGGVGKTLISCALAHYFAENRNRTLLVEFASEESKADSELIGALKQTGPSLWRLKLSADQAAYEYLHLKIGSKKLLAMLWSHPLLRALSALMPGLADLTRLGKIWFHADEQYALTPEQIYQKIVVDMPSSGFVKRFLSIASVVHEAVKIGPIAQEAKLIKEYMRKPQNALIHLTTLPEELIVNESRELYEELCDQRFITLGGLFINRVIASKKKKYAIPENLLGLRSIDSFFSQKIKKQNRELRILSSLAMPNIIIEEQFGELMLAPVVKALREQLGHLPHG